MARRKALHSPVNELQQLAELTAPEVRLPTPSQDDVLAGAAIRQSASDTTAIPINEVDVSTSEVLGAAFRTQNIIGSIANEVLPTPLEDDPALSDDDVVKRVREEGLGPYLMDFTDVGTESEFRARVEQVRKEDTDRKLLASASTGGSLAAELAVGIVDPTNWIPGFGIVRKGLSLRQKVQQVSALTAGQTIAQEAILQGTQATRTLEESVSAVALSSLLGGIIGGGAHYFSGAKSPLSGARKEQIRKDVGEYVLGRPGRGGVGAEQVDAYLANTERAIGQAGAKGAVARQAAKISDGLLMRPLGFDIKWLRNPEVELLSSVNPMVRRIAQRIFNQTRVTADNEAGIRNPTGQESVSDIVRGQRGRLAEAQYATQEAYKQMGGGRWLTKQADKRAGGIDRTTMADVDGEKLDMDQFSQRVYKAMINDDVDPAGNEAISKLAAIWRKMVFDPILKELQAAGRLPDDIEVKGALSYVTRIYDRDAIQNDLGDVFDDGSFLNIAYNYHRANLEAANDAIDANRATVTRERARISKENEEAAKKVREESQVERDKAAEERDTDTRIADQNFQKRIRETLDKAGRGRRDRLDDMAEDILVDGPVKADFARHPLRSEHGFKGIFASRQDWSRKISENYDKALKRINAEEQTNLRAAQQEVPKPNKSKLSEADIDKKAKHLARRTRRRILSQNDQYQDYEVTLGVKGYERSRTFLVDDNVLSGDNALGKSYLKQDLFDIGQRYNRSAGADAALSKVFRRPKPGEGPDAEGIVPDQADVDLKWHRDQIVEEARFEVEELRAAGRISEGEEKAILDQAEREAKVVEDQVSLLRGTYMNTGAFDSPSFRKFVQGMGMLNYVRLMGGTVLSSIPDVANMGIANGFANTWKHGVLPILREVKDVGWEKTLKDGELSRLSRLAGANLEMVLNQRVAQMAGLDIDQGFKIGSAHFDQTAQQTLTRRFGKMTGITYWNALMKQVAFNTTQARLIDDAVRGWSKLSKREQAWLANLGIDEDTLHGIGRQFDRQTDKSYHGVYIADYDNWQSRVIADRFKAAVGRESSNVIITPEASDLPTFYNTPIGRMLMQFRSHMMASQARIVGRNLQLAGIGQSDAGTMTFGMTAMLILAGLTDYTKYMLGHTTLTGDNKKEKRTGSHEAYAKKIGDDPVGALFNVLDRGTFAPIAFDMDATLEKLTGETLSARSLMKAGGHQLGIGDPKATGAGSRKKNRNLADTLGGPTLGLLGDAGTAASGVGGALVKGKAPSRAQFKAGRRLLPYQNAPVFQQGLNSIESLYAQ